MIGWMDGFRVPGSQFFFWIVFGLFLLLCSRRRVSCACLSPFYKYALELLVPVAKEISRSFYLKKGRREWLRWPRKNRFVFLRPLHPLDVMAPWEGAYRRPFSPGETGRTSSIFFRPFRCPCSVWLLSVPQHCQHRFPKNSPWFAKLDASKKRGKISLSLFLEREFLRYTSSPY